jgi:hypothetical protein
MNLRILPLGQLRVHKIKRPRPSVVPGIFLISKSDDCPVHYHCPSRDLVSGLVFQHHISYLCLQPPLRSPNPASQLSRSRGSLASQRAHGRTDPGFPEWKYCLTDNLCDKRSCSPASPRLGGYNGGEQPEEASVTSPDFRLMPKL